MLSLTAAGRRVTTEHGHRCSRVEGKELDRHRSAPSAIASVRREWSRAVILTEKQGMKQHQAVKASLHSRAVCKTHSDPDLFRFASRPLSQPCSAKSKTQVQLKPALIYRTLSPVNLSCTVGPLKPKSVCKNLKAWQKKGTKKPQQH